MIFLNIFLINCILFYILFNNKQNADRFYNFPFTFIINFNFLLIFVFNLIYKQNSIHFLLIQLLFLIFFSYKKNLFKEIHQFFYNAKELLFLLIFINLIYIIFYLLKNHYNHIFNWDDFSYWMRFYKIYSLYNLDISYINKLSIFNEFPTNIIQNYPAINSFIFSFFFPYPKYETFYVYYLSAVLIIIGIFDLYRLNENKFNIISFILYLFVFILYLSGLTPLNHNLQVDIYLPLLISLSLLSILQIKLKKLELLSYTNISYSLLLKPPLAIILFLISFIYTRINGIKLKIKYILLCFIPYIVYLLLVIYNLDLEFNHTYNTKLKNINESFQISLIFFQLIYSEFIYGFINFNPSKSFVLSISLTYFCFILVSNKSYKNLIFIICSLFIYLLYLSISYKYIILDESKRFPSFDRYFLSYYLVIFSILLNFMRCYLGKNLTDIVLNIFFINCCYFYPVLVYLFPIIIYCNYYIKSISEKNLVFLIIIFLPILFQIDVVRNRILPSNEMITNSNFLINISKYNSTNNIIKVCNLNQYDYLAFEYYTNFNILFKFIKINDCNIKYTY